VSRVPVNDPRPLRDQVASTFDTERLAARLVRSQLFGLGAADPASFTIATVLLVCVAGVAGLLPARRRAFPFDQAPR
jgi:hypothetical protein